MASKLTREERQQNLQSLGAKIVAVQSDSFQEQELERLTNALNRSLSDPITICQVASVRCIGALPVCLKGRFAPYAGTVIPALVERLKSGDQTLRNAAKSALANILEHCFQVRMFRLTTPLSFVLLQLPCQLSFCVLLMGYWGRLGGRYDWPIRSCRLVLRVCGVFKV